MGSRAVVIVCRTPEAARDWFGAEGGGIVYTRTGRRFFADEDLEAALLDRLNRALAGTGLWAELGDWAALDCEILPWSVKAGELVRSQYAAVGAAALADLGAGAAACDDALRRGVDVAALADRTRERLAGGPVLHRRVPVLRVAGVVPRRPAAGALPGAGRLGWNLPGRRSHVAHEGGRTAGGGRSGRQADPAHRGRSRRTWRRGGRRRLVGTDHRGRRRGDGGQATRPADPRPARHGPAGSEVPRPRVPAAHLRARVRASPATSTGYGSATWPASVRWPPASSRSGPRRWSGSPGVSRCSGCTSACSVCSRWKASRSTPASDTGAPIPAPAHRLSTRAVAVDRCDFAAHRGAAASQRSRLGTAGRPARAAPASAGTPVPRRRAASALILGLPARDMAASGFGPICEGGRPQHRSVAAGPVRAAGPGLPVPGPPQHHVYDLETAYSAPYGRKMRRAFMISARRLGR